MFSENSTKNVEFSFVVFGVHLQKKFIEEIDCEKMKRWINVANIKLEVLVYFKKLREKNEGFGTNIK